MNCLEIDPVAPAWFRSCPAIRRATSCACFLAFLISGLISANAQRAAEGVISVESRSKQFVVVGPRHGPPGNILSGQLRLEPALLAISCERIKEALQHELGQDQRVGLLSPTNRPAKVYLVVDAARSQGIQLVQAQYSKGVSYRIDLPRTINADQLIEVVVKALLLDLANRNSGNAVATEIPAWLTEGLIALLKSTSLKSFGLQPNTPMAYEMRPDTHGFVREQLQNFQPLTFEELSWPENLSATRRKLFEACAQLFVYKLIHLPGGQLCLGQMILGLPNYWNWQVAFLKAFSRHFESTLDIEKWWAVQVVAFTGRDPGQLWTSGESHEKLTLLFRVPVDVHMAAQKLPNRREVDLEEIIASWPASRQTPVLQNLIMQLRNMRVRVATDYLGACDEFRQVLENFLLLRETNDSKKGTTQTNPKVLRQTTLKRLRSIYQGLQSLQSKEPSTVPAKP